MQFGFRQNRGTADAIHCIRRIVDKGESTRTPTILLLLDWEKAFDKVSQLGLMGALERMNVDDKMRRVIGALYRNPTFKVEIDGNSSGWYEQKAGIRQGCPLSPYLFVVLMTVMFADVHRFLGRSTREHRVLGADFDEVLYADDTICISEDARTMNKLIKGIEDEGEKYGMRLNYEKCELFWFGDIGTVRMRDGTRMKPMDEVKYLGCQLNNRADGI